MKIVILGGGPAGLYSSLLIKKANPSHVITIIERNAADVTYGWALSREPIIKRTSKSLTIS